MYFRILILTNHARKQLWARHLTFTEVRTAVLKPDRVVNQSASRIRIVKILSLTRRPKLLIVVLDLFPHKTLEIVTAFYSSKVKKYL